MQNMTELVIELTEVFKGLKDGTITPDVATELNNTCGKIINASKVQLMYAALRQEQPEITFLDGATAVKKLARAQTPSLTFPNNPMRAIPKHEEEANE